MCRHLDAFSRAPSLLQSIASPFGTSHITVSLPCHGCIHTQKEAYQPLHVIIYLPLCHTAMTKRSGSQTAQHSSRPPHIRPRLFLLARDLFPFPVHGLFERRLAFGLERVEAGFEEEVSFLAYSSACVHTARPVVQFVVRRLCWRFAILAFQVYTSRSRAVEDGFHAARRHRRLPCHSTAILITVPSPGPLHDSTAPPFHHSSAM